MTISIQYILGDAGWASLKLSNDEKQFETAVSYLHDSLGDLAKLAVQINNGESDLTALFMAEPGEFRLNLNIDNQTANYEGRWYTDWASWGFQSKDDYESVISGMCNAGEIVQQITEILTNIYETVGTEKYHKKCVEHRFPMDQYRELIRA